MTAPRRAIAGAAVWLGVTLVRVPHLLHPAWGQMLLLFAALVLVPLWLEILGEEGDTEAMVTPLNWSTRCRRWASMQATIASVLLVVSFGLAPGPTAVVLAFPWCVVLLLLAWSGASEPWKSAGWAMPKLCRRAGLVFAAVAAAWLVADRAGLRPLGFGEDIVLLTAVHFHFAGLLLPVIASRTLAQLRPSFLTTVVGVAVITGVPAVAVGITASQLKWGAGYEIAAASLMVLGGGGIAVAQLFLATQSRWFAPSRVGWVISSVSLLVGMLLAALYGWRGVVSFLPWLDVPWMRALHGSINGVGFAGVGTLAWFWARRSGPESDQVGRVNGV